MLVDNKLVEKGQLDHRTNYYAITDAGIAETEERREWDFDRYSEVR